MDVLLYFCVTVRNLIVKIIKIYIYINKSTTPLRGTKAGKAGLISGY